MDSMSCTETISRSECVVGATRGRSRKERNVRVLHQTIYFNHVDFENEHIVGTTFMLAEIHRDAQFFCLNSNQCKVHMVEINGMKAEFDYCSTFLRMFPENPSRALDASTFKRLYETRRRGADPKELRGELAIALPGALSEKRNEACVWFQAWIVITFSAVKPAVGLNFRVHRHVDGSIDWSCTHMFCSPPPDSARCCFPCVDACWALCTWDLRFTAPRHLTVVATGDYIKSSLTADGDRKVSTFKVRIPTCPANIAFAIGAFEVFVDPFRPQITSFCLRGAERRLQCICRETGEIIACFEKYLEVWFPHSTYKQVSRLCLKIVEILRLMGMVLLNEDPSRNKEDPNERSDPRPGVWAWFPFPFERIRCCRVLPGPTKDERFDTLITLGFCDFTKVFVEDVVGTAQVHSTIALFNLDVLHSPKVIEDAFETRKLLASAVSRQFFGCFTTQRSWSDYWVSCGAAGLLVGVYVKKTFGINVYLESVRSQMKEVIEFEKAHGGFRLHCIEEIDDMHGLVSPCTSSTLLMNAYEKKSRLVFRMLQKRIGDDIMRSTLRTILLLARTSVISYWATEPDPGMSEAYLEPDFGLFLTIASLKKAISLTSGLDLDSFFDTWVLSPGHVTLDVSYTFLKRTQMCELVFRQRAGGHSDIPTSPCAEPMKRGCRIFRGSVPVWVQEMDGFHRLTVSIDGPHVIVAIPMTYNLQCRRIRWKKVMIWNGDEVDMSLLNVDTENPILWIQIDPEYHLLREIVFEPPDCMLQMQVKYDRDVLAQLDALDVLENRPSMLTRAILGDLINSDRTYWNVRFKAANVVTKMASLQTSHWSGQFELVEMFKRHFGSSHGVVDANDFSRFESYFVQKALPIAIGKLRGPTGFCPPAVTRFLLSLLINNDNTRNYYLDDHYRSALIEALGETSSPFLTTCRFTEVCESSRSTLKEIVKCLNLEVAKPSYRFCVTVACLKAIRKMETTGIISVQSPEFYRRFTARGIFFDVREAAIRILADLLGEQKQDRNRGNDEKDLIFLLNIALFDEDPRLRLSTAEILAQKPPFVAGSNGHQHPADTDRVRKLIWYGVNQKFHGDQVMRNAFVNVWKAMYAEKYGDCLNREAGSVTPVGWEMLKADIFELVSEELPRPKIVLKSDSLPRHSIVREESITEQCCDPDCDLPRPQHDAECCGDSSAETQEARKDASEGELSDVDLTDYSCPVVAAKDEIDLYGDVSTVFRDGVRKKRCCEGDESCLQRWHGDEDSDDDGSSMDMAPEALLSPATFWLRAKGRMGRRGIFGRASAGGTGSRLHNSNMSSAAGFGSTFASRENIGYHLSGDSASRLSVKPFSRSPSTVGLMDDFGVAHPAGSPLRRRRGRPPMRRFPALPSSTRSADVHDRNNEGDSVSSSSLRNRGSAQPHHKVTGYGSSQGSLKGRILITFKMPGPGDEPGAQPKIIRTTTKPRRKRTKKAGGEALCEVGTEENAVNEEAEPLPKKKAGCRRKPLKDATREIMPEEKSNAKPPWKRVTEDSPSSNPN